MKKIKHQFQKWITKNAVVKIVRILHSKMTIQTYQDSIVIDYGDWPDDLCVVIELNEQVYLTICPSSLALWDGLTIVEEVSTLNFLLGISELKIMNKIYL